MKVVIIGTGLTNSLLAGALSRTDYEVVQIDCLDQYGGEEFPMKTLEQLLSMPESLISIYSSIPQCRVKLILLFLLLLLLFLH